MKISPEMYLRSRKKLNRLNFGCWARNFAKVSLTLRAGAFFPRFGSHLCKTKQTFIKILPQVYLCSKKSPPSPLNSGVILIRVPIWTGSALAEVCALLRSSFVQLFVLYPHSPASSSRFSKQSSERTFVKTTAVILLLSITHRFSTIILFVLYVASMMGICPSGCLAS